MNRKSKFRKAVFSLALCVGVFCAWCSVLLMAGQYFSARNKLNVQRQELQAWDACRKTKADYFRSNADTVAACLNNYEEARDDPWMSLPKDRLVGLFVLTALGSAAGGTLVTWTALWIVGLTIYKFFSLLVCCFRHDLCR
jgi:hypothetical protein